MLINNNTRNEINEKNYENWIIVFNFVLAFYGGGFSEHDNEC
jgi:hypothetical protein